MGKIIFATIVKLLQVGACVGIAFLDYRLFMSARSGQEATMFIFAIVLQLCVLCIVGIGISTGINQLLDNKEVG